MAIQVCYWHDFANEEEKKEAFKEGPFVIVSTPGGWRIEVELADCPHTVLLDSTIYKFIYNNKRDPGKFIRIEEAEDLCDWLNGQVKKGAIVKKGLGYWIAEATYAK